MNTKETKKSWGIWSPWGGLWNEAFYNRQRAMAFAVERCIGAGEFERLETTEKRWKLAYRRGHRLVRVTVTLSS
jgi:hypothetical protein